MWIMTQDCYVDYDVGLLCELKHKTVMWIMTQDCYVDYDVGLLCGL